MQEYELKLIGEYGTFNVEKNVMLFAEDAQHAYDLAYEHTGICLDLEAIGWTVEMGEGEEWTIEILTVDGVAVDVPRTEVYS